MDRDQRACSDCVLRGGCGLLDLAGEQGAQETIEVDEFRADAPIALRPGRLFAVRSGAVKSLCADGVGGVGIIDLRFPGDLIGLESVAEPGSDAVEFRAAIPMTTVCHIRFDADAARRSSRRFCERLSAELAARIRSTYRYRQMIRSGARLRVAHYLTKAMRAAPLSGGRGPQRLPAVSRTDIAGYLHMRAETVSRVLSDFRRSGWIGGPVDRIEVVDRAAIEALVHAGLPNA